MERCKSSATRFWPKLIVAVFRIPPHRSLFGSAYPGDILSCATTFGYR
jgi:hypothetical protein